MNMMRTLISAAVVVVLALPVHADVKEDLQGIKKEIKEKKNLLNKTRKVETQVSKELGTIERSLQEKEASLAALGRDLKVVETQLDRTQREAEAVKNDAERKKQQIRVRLSALYKAGEMGNARMFFSSESFPQMVENLRYMRSVLDNDRILFAQYNEKIAHLKVLKESLERDALRKERIKTGMEHKKQEIEVEKKKKASYLVQVRADKKGYQESLKELEANARKLQVMVEKLEARSRKSYTKQNKRSIGGGLQLPPVADKGFGSLKGHLSMPAKGELVGSFGRHKHPEFNSYTVSNGITIAAPVGTDIRSVYEGQIIFADYFKGYGNMVIVDHGGGYFSLYAHAERILKKVGAPVSRNETVAKVGDTDSTRGAMLYFEIRYQGKPVDPAPWFR
ncbi:MAG TPA: peptidoglycan DD-metalloendopeptidase family protein [Geobacteraceae bacterium]|nr:peptidoglycan DD-metalloendopeptidase family protein [Geobacteraceae bacterium]